MPSTFATIHSFSGEGRTLAGVIQGSDGRLYGTTTGEEAKTLSHGGVFGVDLSGSGFAMIHEFAAYPDGDTPAASLLRASDGMLYGTTRAGGWSNVGMVFRLDLSGAPPSLTGVAPASGTSLGGVALTILGEHFRPGAVGAIGGALLDNSDNFDHGTIFAVSPVVTAGTLNDVTVTNTDGQSATLSAGFFADFLDASADDQFHAEIETIFRAGITAGCGAGNYCTDAPASRAQMAVLLLKVEHGAAYVPPPCAGVFPDVACPSLFADWIEQFATEALTVDAAAATTARRTRSGAISSQCSSSSSSTARRTCRPPAPASSATSSARASSPTGSNSSPPKRSRSAAATATTVPTARRRADRWRRF